MMLQLERSPGISVLLPGWDLAVFLPCFSSAWGLGRGICVGQWDCRGFPWAEVAEANHEDDSGPLCQQPAQLEGEL